MKYVLISRTPRTQYTQRGLTDPESKDVVEGFYETAELATNVAQQHATNRGVTYLVAKVLSQTSAKPTTETV